jgi:hypothetical protein
MPQTTFYLLDLSLEKETQSEKMISRGNAISCAMQHFIKDFQPFHSQEGYFKANFNHTGFKNS